MVLKTKVIFLLRKDQRKVMVYLSQQSFAIELAELSNEIWKTACTKRYRECAIGETAEFKIKNPSLIFCYIEPSCSMHLWDTNELLFKKMRLSD